MSIENNELSGIKIYKDIYANKDEVLLGFKGKTDYNTGVIFMKKPGRLRTIYINIINWFKYKVLKKKPIMVELHGTDEINAN